jgi:hypothetical protein
MFRDAAALSIATALVLSACGGPASTSPQPTTPAEPPPRPAILAQLRLEGGEELLAALERNPSDPDAHARLALYYASSRVAGMSLIWGLTRAALQPGAGDRSPVARAMTAALVEHISVERNGSDMRMSTSLAPGAVPAIVQADNSVVAPVAHLFELQLGMGLVGFDGQWTLAAIAGIFSTYLDVLRQRGSPLDPHLEIHPWLLQLAASGHLEAFIYDAFGPAFAPELAAHQAAHADAYAAMSAWIAAHPFRPTHAILPDDLVRIR